MRGREELVLLTPKNAEYRQEKSTLMPREVYSQSSSQEDHSSQQQQHSV